MARRSGIDAPEERLRIKKEGEAEGVLNTCRKYGISRETYYQWKNRYGEGGIEATRPRQGPNGFREIRVSEMAHERLPFQYNG